MKRIICILSALVLPCIAFAQSDGISAISLVPDDKQSQSTTTVTVQVDPQVQIKRASEHLSKVKQLVTSLSVSTDSISSVKVPQVQLSNADIRSAAKTLSSITKQVITVDKDVPQDSKITLSAKNVKLSSILDLLTQSAGVYWGQTYDATDKKWIIKIGGKPVYNMLYGGDAKSIVLSSAVDDNQPSFQLSPELLQMVPSKPLVYTTAVSEVRSVFVCPHCKGQVTVLRQVKQPHCPKCNRVFQPDWEFCPFDGSKRPPLSGEWKFCPLCGKPVEMDKDIIHEK